MQRDPRVGLARLNPVSRSAGARIRFPYDLAPMFDLGHQEVAEAVGRAARRDQAFVQEAPAIAGVGQDFAGRQRQLLGIGLVHAGWPQHAVPRAEFVAGQRVGHGRHGGHDFHARGAADRQGIYLPGLDLRLGDGRAREHQLYLPAQQIRHGGRRALVRYQHQVDTGFALEHFRAQMAGRADAGQGHVQRARLGLRQRDEFGQGAGLNRRMRHQEGRRRGQIGHRLEALYRVVSQIVVQRGIDRVAGVAHKQRAAIGIGMRDRLRGDVAASAGLVIDHEGAAAHVLAQFRRQQACDRRRPGRAPPA